MKLRKIQGLFKIRIRYFYQKSQTYKHQLGKALEFPYVIVQYKLHQLDNYKVIPNHKHKNVQFKKSIIKK